MTRLRITVRILLMAAMSFVAVAPLVSPVAGADQELTLDDLANWTRDPNNPIFLGNEFAGDPFVWAVAPGDYRMVYTDSVDDRQAIAMAASTDLVHWTPIPDAHYPNGVVLQGPGPGGHDPHLETAIYRETSTGTHQIYYIGYEAEETYHAAIYKAESDAIEGPYVRETDPVIAWSPEGADAAAMTSPTIVEMDGTLYMTYIGWETFPDGPVSIMGATSTDDGQTWDKTGPLSWEEIFGVEAETVQGPDGLYYRVGITSDDQGGDVISLGRAEHPFGPYTELPQPILTPAGPDVGEGDTIMSPSLLFVAETGTAYLYYSAVDTGGWPWVVSLATSDYRTS